MKKSLEDSRRCWGGDNIAANKAFQYVIDTLELNADQARELHDMITGEGMSRQEIMELAKSWFLGE